MIGSPLQHPMEGPYINDKFASVIPTSLRKIIMYMVTWTIHDHMKDYKGVVEAGERERVMDNVRGQYELKGCCVGHH